MKSLIKLLIILLTVIFLTSCITLFPRESIDENSSGVYGYFEFDENAKFYNKELFISFWHVDNEQTRYLVMRGAEINEDHSFWIPNVEPGTYVISEIAYYSVFGNTRYYISFDRNENNFVVGKGELYYWGAFYCEERDDSYFTEPHMEASKEEVLNSIEAELLEDNWGEWLERERETLK